MSAMTKEYGPEKGERVFYASRNKGTIKGVEPKKKAKGGKTAEKPTFPGPFSENYDELYEKPPKKDVGKAHGGRARKRADR
jgi:hypothetical protein